MKKLQNYVGEIQRVNSRLHDTICHTQLLDKLHDDNM